MVVIKSNWLQCAYFLACQTLITEGNFLILQLKFQLSYATSEVPCKIESAVKDAESTTARVSRFSREKQHLCDDISNHQADVITMIKDISTLTDEIKELEKYTKYMQIVGKIEDLR